MTTTEENPSNNNGNDNSNYLVRWLVANGYAVHNNILYMPQQNTPTIRTDENHDNSSLLIQALKKNESTTDEILHIIAMDPMSVQQKDIHHDNYPLHIACGCKATYEINNGSIGTGTIFGTLIHNNQTLPYHRNHDIVIMKLLDLFPDACQHKDKDGNYPLHIACYHHHSEVVIMKLIELYPEAVKYHPESYTDAYALHVACRYIKSNKVIQTLLEIYPAALYHQDKWLLYPIHHLIVYRQSVDIIQRLIETDPIHILPCIDSENRTPLHAASWNSRVDVVEILLQYDSIIHINAQDMFGKTSLHYACRFGYDGVAQLLLQHPTINVNALTDEHESPLHTILMNQCGNYLPIYEMLLYHPFIRLDIKNQHNETIYDIIDKKMIEYETRNDNNFNDNYNQLIEMKRLLVDEVPKKSKWQSYQYLLQNWVN